MPQNEFKSWIGGALQVLIIIIIIICFDRSNLDSESDMLFE